MFKNLIVYRIGPDWSTTIAQVEENLSKACFVECGATQPFSAGWTWPRGTAHGPFVEVVAGQWLLKMMVEQKVLPTAVVKRRTEEMAGQIEQATGRKPGKKQMKEIKDEAVLSLLPLAFTKQASVNVWLNLGQRLLMVDASSPARADDVVTQLVKAFDGLSVTLLQTAQSPAAAMSEWLLGGEPPSAFSVDRECELKSADEMKSVVRYSRHALDIEEVRQHIAAGKVPTKLALTWQGRVSFLLTETMQIKKIAFLDGVFEGAGKVGKDEAFDADAAIATGELGRLIPDLIDALGGEQAIGGGAAAPAAAVVAAETASTEGAPW
ncbi:MAG: recombination-associated protein RdgC [Bacteriovorax sp.]|nr:recombination-associated protein RdgC [Rhizobacter sp.]